MIRTCAISAALAAVLCGRARAQVTVGQRLPSGQTVTIRHKTPDPKKEAERLRKRCGQEIAAARKHITNKKWRRARICLDKAAGFARDKAQAKEVVRLASQVDAEGRRRLEEADKHYRAGEYLKAIEQCRRIVRTFGSLPSGRKAGKALKRAKSDPAAREAMLDSKAGALDRAIERMLAGHFSPVPRAAATMPARRAGSRTKPAPPKSRPEAIARLPIKKADRAVELLERIARRYGQCPTGRAAAEDMGRLRADEGFMSALQAFRDRKRARAAFGQAEAYRKAGLRDKALECYRKIVKEYPAAPEAAKAKAVAAALQARKRGAG